jgi:photosystem II stability/assembly factor-like uncharacterized protein
MNRFLCLSIAIALCAGNAAAQQPQPRLKAIWEPINYPDDLTLMSVSFVSDDLGWISGGANWDKGGFILQTKDGGAHWAVQLGDPQSDDPSIKELRFLDATHGWGVQKDKLVRTTDGSRWEDAGSLPRFVPLEDYTFTTPAHGIFTGGYSTEGSKIFTTDDGGQTWKQVYQCAAKVEVNGLMRNTGCHLFALDFPTPSVGYAVGGSFNDGPGEGFFVVTKTQDGGKSWTLVASIANTPHGEAVHFTSATTGVSRNNDGKFYITQDGGATWKGATGSHGGHPHPFTFADGQVGWAAGERGVAYTTDGGMHWYSRDMQLPATIQAFGVAGRQRAYLVGEHGMIYRYRVVAADYTAKGMLAAPMMPASP